jgi:hypothetical protein
MATTPATTGESASGRSTAASKGDPAAAVSAAERASARALSLALDWSIIIFTLGENLTPDEKSLAILLTSGPLDVDLEASPIDARLGVTRG